MTHTYKNLWKTPPPFVRLSQEGLLSSSFSNFFFSPSLTFSVSTVFLSLENGSEKRKLVVFSLSFLKRFSMIASSKFHARCVVGGALAPPRLAVQPARRPALPPKGSFSRVSAIAESAKVSTGERERRFAETK